MPNESEVIKVILIRHAERVNSGTQDPHLNAKGLARAKSLVRIMGGAEIKAIYTSHFTRAKETARPLANHLGIAPVEIDEAADLKTDILENHSGKTVLVVGHSNTVPELIGLLGSTNVPVIEETEFDKLFVLTTFGPEASSSIQLRYGDPS